MSLVRLRALKRAADPSWSSPTSTTNKRIRSTTPSRPWRDLPLIVRDQILAELRDDYDPYSARDKKRRANYAVVSVEWQQFFEAANFSRLVFNRSDFHRFDQFLQRRRGYLDCWSPSLRRVIKRDPASRRHMPVIRHIWLRIELPKYGCDTCIDRPWDDYQNDAQRFTHALWDLLVVLQRWERNGPFGEGQQDGLTLELSAHSPSDAMHMFQHDAGSQSNYPFLADDSVQQDFIQQYRQSISRGGTHTLNDEHHFFHDGRLHLPLEDGPRGREARLARERLVHNLNLSNLFWLPNHGRQQSFPEVKMVTSLLFRRQYYRGLLSACLSKIFRQCLTGLRGIRRESWRVHSANIQDTHDRAFGPTRVQGTDNDNVPSSNIRRRTTLGDWLPPSLESLHLFEDFNEAITGKESMTEPRPSRLYILTGLATSAPGIKHLSVSFLSDTMECLDLHGADGALFPNLESIALTSQHHLRPDHPGLNDLLQKAAFAAMKMPKLQIMEIWNCGNGNAAFFRYEATGNEVSSACRITWRCSWAAPIGPLAPFPFEDRVVEAWGEVASTIAHRNLIFDVKKRLPKRRYREYAGILGHLKLKRSILHATSEMQVCVGLESEEEVEGEVDAPVWEPVTPYSPGNPRRAILFGYPRA